MLARLSHDPPLIFSGARSLSRLVKIPALQQPQCARGPAAVASKTWPTVHLALAATPNINTAAFTVPSPPSSSSSSSQSGSRRDLEQVGRPIPATPAASPVAAQPIYEQHPLGPLPPYTPSSDGILAPPALYGKGHGGRGLPSEGSDFHQHTGFDEKKWIAQPGEQDDDGLPTKRKSALERFTGLFGSATRDIKDGKDKDVAV